MNKGADHGHYARRDLIMFQILVVLLASEDRLNLLAMKILDNISSGVSDHGAEADNLGGGNPGSVPQCLSPSFVYFGWFQRGEAIAW